MPPVRITTSIPKASSPVVTICLSRLVRLVWVRKPPRWGGHDDERPISSVNATSTVTSRPPDTGARGQGLSCVFRPIAYRGPVPRWCRRRSARRRGGPARITSTRSVAPSTSVRSEEMSSTARPCAGQVVDHAVDVDPGRHVHAPGRLVEDQHPGLANSHLARTAFCWLPPLRLYDRHRRAPGRAGCRAVRSCRRRRPVRRPRSMNGPRRGGAPGGQRRCCPGPSCRGSGRCRARSSVTSASPARIASVRGFLKGEWPMPFDGRYRPVWWGGSRRRAQCASSVRPEPTRPKSPTISPGAAESNVRELPVLLPRPFDGEQRLAGRAAGRIDLFEATAGHQADQLVFVGAAGRGGGDDGAVL